MKLLNIMACGLPLFKGTMEMSFYAKQRVAEDDKLVLHSMGQDGRFFTNNATAVIGINASGKTSVLKVIQLTLDIVGNRPINHSETRDILGSAADAVFTIDFLSDDEQVCRLVTHITKDKKNSEQQYRITEESLFEKPLSSVVTKKSLLDFSGIEPSSIRTNEEAYLPEDVSIMIAFNKRHGQKVYVASMLAMTNVNVLPVSADIPREVIQFLDPTVEHLFFRTHEGKTTIHLKFIGQKEITLSDPIELNRYLSSGTIKGIVVFTYALQILREGGYLILDEIEDHFNREIATTLTRFFMEEETNIHGSGIVFTTHYPELLDEFNRKDSIYITRNRMGIEVSNLTELINRNDIKKSDVYQSGMLEGTTPAYEAYIKLRKSIWETIQRGDGDV